MGIAKVAKRWLGRAVDFGRARRTRKIGLIVSAVVVFYGLLGYFGGPILIRHIASGSVAQSLQRPVSVGRAVLNPYTLNLNLYQIQIGEHTREEPFIDIARLHVKVSWTSLFHLAPIVSVLTVERPTIHVVRIDEQRFNFSDLLESRQPSQPGKPQRFAISNIRVNNGEIHLDDNVLGQHHAITYVNIGIPFVANLPADTNIYVQPLLTMVIDGSPFRIAGNAKPFSTPPESLLNLNLRRLDLSRYAAYLPQTFAVKLPQGELSCALQVHFVAASPEPLIRLTGGIVLDQLNLRDRAGAPLVFLEHASMELNEVEPFRRVAAFGAIRIDGLSTYVVRNHDGTLNLTSLTKGGSPAISAQGPGNQPQPSLQQPPRPVTKALPGAVTGNQSPAGASSASPAASTGPSSTPKPAATPSPFGSVPSATDQAALTPSTSATAKAENKPPSATHSTAIVPVSPIASTPAPPPVSIAGIQTSPSPAAGAPASSAKVMPSPASTTSPAPASIPPPGTQTAAQTTVTNVSVQSLSVANSTINITDHTGAKPAKLALEKIHVFIHDLHTVGTKPATLEVGANLNGGGLLAAKGTLDLPQSKAAADIRLDQVNLPALQAFAQSQLTADVASGQLSAHGNVRMDLATGHFNIELKPATVVIDRMQIDSPGRGENPISWSKLSTSIGEVNLAKREANINEVRADKLNLFLQRQRNGQLSLVSLVPPATPPTTQPGIVPHSNGKANPPPAAAPWQFRVNSLVLANNNIHVRDESMAEPID